LSSCAELCAIDVRSGNDRLHARPRAETRNYRFLTQESRVREEIEEATVRTAAVATAQDLVAAVAKRLGS
jgi:hypothetical protein